MVSHRIRLKAGGFRRILGEEKREVGWQLLTVGTHRRNRLPCKSSKTGKENARKLGKIFGHTIPCNRLYPARQPGDKGSP
jgi:hypothetical protein